MARLRNILRRTGALSEMPSRLKFADLMLDEDTFEVTSSRATDRLTATEFRLLRYLMLNPRRVLTRGQLLDHVWSYDFGGDARVLETYISYLRKKVDASGPPLRYGTRGRLRSAIAHRLSGLSLRARLLIGLGVLAAFGLAAARIATYEEQRSFLFKRVDPQVGASQFLVAGQLGVLRGAPPGLPRRIVPLPTRRSTPFQASGSMANSWAQAGRC